MKLLTTLISLILTLSWLNCLYATVLYENLLTNPGFENGWNGWNQTGGTAVYEKSYSAHSESASAKGIETYKYNLGRLYQDLTGKLKPGKKYKIGGCIKTKDVKGQVVIALDYVNRSGWCTLDSYVKEIGYVTGNTEWQYFESNWFILPQMPGNCSMLWFLFDFNNGEGTAWFDDVFLYEQSPTNTQEIVEDFSVFNSDWLEYDPKNKIEIDCNNNHRLEFNHWIRYEPGYVCRYWLTQDFVLEYNINITDHGGNGKVVGPGFSDTLGTLNKTQNGIFSVFYAGWPGGGGVPHLDLHIYENGTQILDWKEFLDLRISRSTTYYVRLEKSGDKVTINIFSDASRTNHISGSPKTFKTNLKNTTFKYFYAVNGGHTSPQDNWEWTTGWIVIPGLCEQ